MPDRPNVLVLIADDHRYHSLGATEEEGVRTPVLDGLIAEGACFDRAYAMGGLTGAVCVPSRACFLTGVNAFDAVRSRTVDDAAGLQALHPQWTPLPQAFRDHGYLTYGIGKWHNDMESFNRSFADGAAIFAGGMGDPFALPVRPYDPSGQYPEANARPGPGHATDVFADAALDFLRTYEAERPFFLYVAFTAPHDPRTAPEPFADMYDPGDPALALPPNAYPRHPFAMGDLDIRDERLAAFPRTEAEVRGHVADYYGMISHMDQRIGDILQSLHARGWARNTIVLYLSDHGLALGQHGLMGKQNLYEHSLRIPCVWRGPGIAPGQRSPRLAQHMDAFPTLCQLAGIPLPQGVQGVSLFAAERERAQKPLLAAYKYFQRGLIGDRLKLIRHYVETEAGWRLAYEQLFDVLADPFEMHNLAFAPAYQDAKRRLARTLRERQREYADPLLEALAPNAS